MWLNNAQQLAYLTQNKFESIKKMSIAYKIYFYINFKI